MIKVRTREDILKLLRNHLRYGIVDSSGETYKTNTFSMVLLIYPDTHYLEVASYGHPLFKLQFEEDNRTWKEVVFTPVTQTKCYSFLETITREYKYVKEEKGLHAL
jgi:hypothetical protein